MIILVKYLVGVKIDIMKIYPLTLKIGEKKIEELSLPTEQLDKTRHDKIFVLNDIDMTDETLSKVIIEIKKLENSLSGQTANQVRNTLSSILPEYKPSLESNEPVYLRLEAKA